MFNFPTIPQVELKALIVLVILIFVNAVFGVILAQKTGQFDARKLPQFLQSTLLYIGGLVVLFVFGIYVPYLMALFIAAAAALTYSYGKDIKDKAIALFGAFNAPEPPEPGGSEDGK